MKMRDSSTGTFRPSTNCCAINGNVGINMTSQWKLLGQVLLACNCDWGCPCNFNALPTTGKCEGGWTWQVEQGAFGDVRLDGLTFSVFVKWPGAIHHGNGQAVIFL